MSDFMNFFDEKVSSFPMRLEIYYSSVCDWNITVYKGRSSSVDATIICSVQNCDMLLCFAMAHVALKEWLLENEGSY